MANHRIPIHELIGKKFSRWSVLAEADPYVSPKGTKYRKMRCQCECGTTKLVSLYGLRRGESKSCGCLSRESATAPNHKTFIDLTGQKFKRVTVIKRVKNKGKELQWLCKCDCGVVKEVNGRSLRRGTTKSCGCLQRKVARKIFLENNPVNHALHGDSTKRIYRTWQAMKSRCSRKTDKSYKWYGAKGIFFYNKWRDYIPFKIWALKNGYAHNLVLDRIEPNGGYTPDNCQFITQIENLKRRYLT